MKTKYQEILQELRKGTCSYGNEKTGVSFSIIEKAMMKTKSDGSIQFFNSLEQMARSINRFFKTGY